MYYRRKLLLGILEKMGGSVDKMSLQKLAFLVCQKQQTALYDFVPYKYGCYSFQMAADLSALEFSGSLTQGEKDICLVGKGYYNQLTSQDKILLNQLAARYKQPARLELVKYTYRHYPFYAINSLMASKIMEPDEIGAINAKRPARRETALLTIGYEGQTIEAYLVKLITNDVRTLVDVRKNPLSRKHGFSKNQLATYCKGLGISYVHLPEWGIESDLRQELNSAEDYKRLFQNYQSRLDADPQALESLAKYLETLDRPALTCFEAEHTSCHRGTLAKALTKLKNWNLPLIHL